MRESERVCVCVCVCACAFELSFGCYSGCEAHVKPFWQNIIQTLALMLTATMTYNYPQSVKLAFDAVQALNAY